MQRFRICLLSVCALVIIAVPHAATAQTATTRGNTVVPQARWLPGTVILKLKDYVPNNRGAVQFGIPALDIILQELQADARRPLFPLAPYTPVSMRKGSIAADTITEGYDRFYVITYTAQHNVLWVIEQIAKTGAVEFADPYHIFDYSFIPDDPMYNQQPELAQLHAEEAWDITRGDSSIVIGICDSGVELEHEDLAANIYTNTGETGTDGEGKDKRTNSIDDDGNGLVDDWRGWDLVGNTVTPANRATWQPDNNTTVKPLSDSDFRGYHGTRVSGCAAAVTNNQIGVAAIANGCRILPIKCTTDSIGTGSVYGGYDGIRYAADMGARVINCSFGNYLAPQFTSSIQATVDYAYSKGALVVGASGNTARDVDVFPQYPANLNHAICVGGVSADNTPASFSSYGLNVDVWAPGENIATTDLENGYKKSGVNGTSFSAPIVSGVAALIFSEHPDWTPDQVAMQLRVTGDRVVTNENQPAYKYYRTVNAQRALTINSSLAGGAPNTMPGIGILLHTVNGNAVDTIRNLDEIVTVAITFRNYLAPSVNLVAESYPNGQLMTVSPVAIGEIGTMENRTVEFQVRIDPSSQITFSEGELQLVLRLSDGEYEDLVGITIPVYLPGWHRQYDPVALGSPIEYRGAAIHAASPTVAWNVLNAITSQSTLEAFYTRNLDGNGWVAFSQFFVSGGINGLPAPVRTITALDAQRAWVGGATPDNNSVAIYTTTSGGGAWDMTDVSAITPQVNGIHFFDSMNGIFIGNPIGSNWGIGVTEDGGATWNPLNTPHNVVNGTEAGWINSIAAYGDTLLYGTNQNRIYRSVDRGQTWEPFAAPEANAYGIALANGRDGMAIFRKRESGVGENAIAVTRNGGENWALTRLPDSTATPQSIAFVPDTTLAFLATDIGIFQTIDFGETWKQMASPPIEYSGIQLSAAIDTATGAIGAFGTNDYSQLIAFRFIPEPPDTSTTDVEHTTGSSHRSATAQLHVPVPNPTSGNVVIAYRLFRQAEIALTLYDAAGRRVRVLEQGKRQEGEHSSMYDTSNLPAGNYYYTLQIGNEQLTRPITVVR